MELDGIRAYNSAIMTQPTPKNVALSQTPADGLQQIEQTTDSDAQSIKGGSQNYKTEKTDEKQKGLDQQKDEASAKMIQTAIDTANKQLKNSHRMLQYSMHEKTKRVMVKVIDTQTEEVVREIPPEKTLDLFVKVLELAGIMYDEKK